MNAADVWDLDHKEANNAADDEKKGDDDDDDDDESDEEDIVFESDEDDEDDAAEEIEAEAEEEAANKNVAEPAEEEKEIEQKKADVAVTFNGVVDTSKERPPQIHELFASFWSYHSIILHLIDIFSILNDTAMLQTINESFVLFSIYFF